MAFNSPHMGSLMDPLGKIMQPDGSGIPANRVPPQGQSTTGLLGAMAMPTPQPVEPPAATQPQFEERVKRNEGFLAQPEVQAALMQFAVSMLSPGQDLGSSIGQGFEAAGRVASNQQDQSLIDRKMNLEERGMNVQEAQQTLSEQELRLKAAAMGGRKYSRIVSGDSPIGMEMGLGKGERARVAFTEDKDGNILSADMEANPLDTSGTNKGTQVTQLLNEAKVAEDAGDHERAGLLRTAAEKAATGQTTAGSLEPGTKIEVINGVETVVPIKGGKADLAQQDAAKMAGSKRINEVQTAINVRKAVNESLSMIKNSRLPPDLVMTGPGSYLEYVRGTPAANLKSTIETVQSNIGFIKLQDIRDASKTGGALGAVSDFENRLLQATVANLATSQNSGILTRNLRYVQAIFTDAEYSGRLTDIGRRLEKGEINNAQAVNEAGEYLDRLVRGDQQAEIGAQKDLAAKPAPHTPPPGADNRAKTSWDFMTPGDKQRAEELINKSKQGKE